MVRTELHVDVPAYGPERQGGSLHRKRLREAPRADAWERWACAEGRRTLEGTQLSRWLDVPGEDVRRAYIPSPQRHLWRARALLRVLLGTGLGGARFHW